MFVRCKFPVFLAPEITIWGSETHNAMKFRSGKMESRFQLDDDRCDDLELSSATKKWGEVACRDPHTQDSAWLPEESVIF